MTITAEVTDNFKDTYVTEVFTKRCVAGRVAEEAYNKALAVAKNDVAEAHARTSVAEAYAKALDDIDANSRKSRDAAHNNFTYDNKRAEFKAIQAAKSGHDYYDAYYYAGHVAFEACSKALAEADYVKAKAVAKAEVDYVKAKAAVTAEAYNKAATAADETYAKATSVAKWSKGDLKEKFELYIKGVIKIFAEDAKLLMSVDKNAVKAYVKAKAALEAEAAESTKTANDY